VADNTAQATPTRKHWISRAACAGVDSSLFFPAKGENLDAAMAICAGCPVKTECLTFALEHDCQGIWGGTTARERARLRRQPSSVQRRQ
jgi:WhiB family redox-sensing transcriptional regulator